MVKQRICHTVVTLSGTIRIKDVWRLRTMYYSRCMVWLSMCAFIHFNNYYSVIYIHHGFIIYSIIEDSALCSTAQCNNDNILSRLSISHSACKRIVSPSNNYYLEINARTTKHDQLSLQEILSRGIPTHTHKHLHIYILLLLLLYTLNVRPIFPHPR